MQVFEQRLSAQLGECQDYLRHMLGFQSIVRTLENNEAKVAFWSSELHFFFSQVSKLELGTGLIK